MTPTTTPPLLVQGKACGLGCCGSPGASPDASSVTLLMLCPCT